MTKVRLERDTNWDRSEEFRKHHEALILWIVDQLKPSGALPAITDEAYAKRLITELIKENDQLRDSLNTKEKEWALKESNLLIEQKSLQDRIRDMERKLLDQEDMISDLREELNDLKTDVNDHKEEVTTVQEMKSFFELIKGFFRK